MMEISIQLLSWTELFTELISQETEFALKGVLWTLEESGTVTVLLS